MDSPNFLEILRQNGVTRLAQELGRHVDDWLTGKGVASGADRVVAYRSWQEQFDQRPEDPVALVIAFDNWSISHLLNSMRLADGAGLLNRLGSRRTPGTT